VARPEPPPLRLAHVSDIHVTARSAWRREDWLNKRLAAWVNLRVLGRGYRFRRADEVLDALRRDLDQRRPDRLLFSGDATAMGFPEEVARAAELLRVGGRPGLAVPGNHDYCTRSAMLSGDFERHFAPWQTGERLDDGDVYPFAQRAGDFWLVAVNSATANRWAWDARGLVGLRQVRRLERLLGRLEGGRRVLVTHYPVARRSGRPEHPGRQLRDLEALVGVARRGGVCLWLHGHIHDPYHHPRLDAAPFPVICAGSATQTGHWSYGEYLVHGDRLRASRRVFDPAAGGFVEGEAFEIDLPRPAPTAVVSGST
jgi:3',5'-cyclic AMP phosphodiesterase CpdA